LAIIARVELCVGSAAVIGGPAGPPGGLDTRIIAPIPVPVEGDVNATVTGDVNVANDGANPVPVTGTVETTSPCCYRFVGYSTDTTTYLTNGFPDIMQVMCSCT
jgi:hypothetical protein